MFLEVIQIQPLDALDELQDASEDIIMMDIWDSDPEDQRWQKTKTYIDPKSIVLIEPHPLEHNWINIELNSGTLLVIDANLEDFLKKLQYAKNLEMTQPLKKIYIT